MTLLIEKRKGTEVHLCDHCEYYKEDKTCEFNYIQNVDLNNYIVNACTVFNQLENDTTEVFNYARY